ncbi:MAG: potassium transporter TrkA [Campylobacter sp.]|nr:potassium transporter TrkA [Campylobacter sp.]
MKEILIIAQGQLARSFVKRLYTARSNLHHYTIISQDSEILQNQNLSDSFTFHNFDATSFSKLKAVASEIFSQYMIIIQDLQTSLVVYENLRKISLKTNIVMLSLWHLPSQFDTDKHLEIVDTRSIIASHFVAQLPDMPAYADNIGLGSGEIIEVKVPIGSSYMYRHLINIKQKRWRIALIYRGGKIIMPRPEVMICPNDSLIIVGEPNVVQRIFRNIKREPGQFPSPFGSNIFVFIDMHCMDKQRVAKLIEDSLFVHENLNNKRIIFMVVNPTLGENLEKLKEITQIKGVNVMFDYFSYKDENLKAQIASNDVGLIICDNKYFFKNKILLYELKIPVLKLGNSNFAEVKQGVILSDGKENIENQSAVIMDFSAQLDMEIRLYFFAKNNDDMALEEHFENLNELFEKRIKIQNCKDINPLIRLSGEENLLQFIAFSEFIAKGGGVALSTNLTKHFKKLSQNSQLFVPLGAQ